ncbi:MAG: Npt1/Npt2 family nucleotide transporter [Candidatus Babeliales bacterium]|jgi:AAA family ATP:ADP antiporter
MNFGVRKRLLSRVENSLGIDRHDAIKLILSAIAFFFIISSYSVLRSLKTSIFLGFVGRQYEPISKFLSIFVTIPAMMLLAKITDKFRRHQVVYCFMGFYAIAALVFALLFAHPVYGVHNTLTSPYRLTGWAFEIIMDLFQALIVGTFWSFLNSICSPTFAGKSYGFIVAASRVGGIAASFLSWFFLKKIALDESIIISGLTAGTGIFLVLAVACIYFITTKIPSENLHGYEAAYRNDEQQSRSKKKVSMFEGLRLMLMEPYVLGIFGLVFSYEIISIIFDYQMHVLMSLESHNRVYDMSLFMLVYTGTFQFVSFLFALFGTSTLLKRVGVKACLLIMPIITVTLAIMPLLCPTLSMFFVVMVILRAINYGFNHPLREILFIPTTKDIKFKSKAWIESFGRTLSKTMGSSFNYITTLITAPYMCLVAASTISCGLSAIWALVALLVGKKYLTTLHNNTVIGKEDSSA